MRHLVRGTARGAPLCPCSMALLYSGKEILPSWFLSASDMTLRTWREKGTAHGQGEGKKKGGYARKDG